jgi:hypothetical protein
MPRLKAAIEKESGKRKILSVCLVLAGFWIGTVFMLLLSLYEHDIEIDIKEC